MSEQKRDEEKLLRYAAILESSDDAIIAKDLDGMILSWNAAAQRIFGYTAEEAIGRSIRIIIPAELHDEEIDILRKLRAGERIEHYETLRMSKDRTQVNVSITVSPIRDAAGRIIGASKIARDITERKRAEAALRDLERKRAEGKVRQSEDMLGAEAEALARLNDCSARLWRTTNLQEGLSEMLVAVITLLSADKGHVQLFDAERGVLTIVAHHGFEQPFLDFHREVSAEHPSASGRALHLGHRVVIEDIETDASLELRSVARANGYRAVVSTPLVSSEGSAVGMLSTYFRSAYQPSEETLRRLDLYARQAAGFIQHCNAERVLCETNRALERQTTTLQAREELLRIFVKNVPVGVAMFDRDMRYLQVSDRWCADYSVDSSQVLGHSHYELFPDLPQRWKEIHRRALQGETLRADEDRWDREGGTTWIRWEIRPWWNFDGLQGGILIFAEDITQRKQTEEDLSKVNQRLIEAQEQERSRLARELHDDINQRIALLAFNLERLKQDLPSRQAELRRRMANECTRVSELGRDIQALSHRLHSSKLEYLGLVGAAKGFCEELADLEHVEIDFHSENVPEELPKETSLCLFRILQEALQNAVKHSGSRHFQVSFGVSLNRVELTVHDSGIGFKPEGAIKGRGLGLTSMKERLKLIDGQLSIESQPGAGTTIRATAPLCFGSEPQRSERQSLKAQEQSA